MTVHTNNCFEWSTFTASKSSLTAITGKSGSGKTTLLNLISGIDKPTGGEIIFNDKVINNSDSLTQFADLVCFSISLSY